MEAIKEPTKGSKEVFTSTERLMEAHLGSSQMQPMPSKDDLAMIVFTSGTTGAAKGVRLTHQALCFQVWVTM